MGYLCGYQAGTAVEGLTGIRAFLQTRTSAALGGFPAGGNLASVVVLQVEDGAALQQLRLRLGYGLFRLDAAMTPTPYLFGELLAGGKRALRLLGHPGADGEFHSYACNYDPAAGSWSLVVDGQRLGTLQDDLWKDARGTVSARQLVPSFLAEVSVVEAPVMGTAKAPAQVEAAQLQLAERWQDQDFAGSGSSAKKAVVTWQSITEVGALGSVDGHADIFTLYPRSP